MRVLLRLVRPGCAQAAGEWVTLISRSTLDAVPRLLLRRPRAYLAPLVSALIVDQMLPPTALADLDTFNTHASTTILVRNT